MKEKARAHIFISGRVQGVYFRENAVKKAQELGIFGWIKNLTDKRVEALFEGEKKKVREMIIWAEQGPKSANVISLEVGWQDYTGEFDNFQVEY